MHLVVIQSPEGFVRRQDDLGAAVLSFKRVEAIFSKMITVEGKRAYPAAVVVPLLRLIRATRRAWIGLLVHLDADVIVVGDLLLVLVISPVFLGRFS